MLVFCSRVLLSTQMEGKYGAGWRTRLGFPCPLLQAIKTWKEERPGNEAGCFIVFGTFYFFIFFDDYSDVGPIGDWCCLFFPANNRLMILLWRFNRRGRIALGSDDVLISAMCFPVQHPLYSCSLYRIAGNIGDL